MKTLCNAAVLFAFALVAAPSVRAQTALELGAYGGFNADDEDFLIGGVSRIRIPTAPFTLNPGLEYYPSIGGPGIDGSLFVMNFDVQYLLQSESLEPYVGGGLFWSRSSINTVGVPGSLTDATVGFNVKGGLLFNTSGYMKSYAEGVLARGGGQVELILKGGLLFPIG